MKKTIATLCLVSSTLALSACMGSNDGYAVSQHRTAVYDSETMMKTMATPTRVAPAENVFREAQTK